MEEEVFHHYSAGLRQIAALLEPLSTDVRLGLNSTAGVA
jgi:hypothetical protein